MEKNSENITYLINEEEEEGGGGNGMNMELDMNAEQEENFKKILKEFNEHDFEMDYDHDYYMEDIDTKLQEKVNYELNYNFKQLSLILEFYGLKTSKLKKQEMIEQIMSFEKNVSENYETIMKRKMYWYCMNEFKNDKFMKRFVIW